MAEQGDQLPDAACGVEVEDLQSGVEERDELHRVLLMLQEELKEDASQDEGPEDVYATDRDSAHTMLALFFHIKKLSEASSADPTGVVVPDAVAEADDGDGDGADGDAAEESDDWDSEAWSDASSMFDEWPAPRSCWSAGDSDDADSDAETKDDEDSDAETKGEEDSDAETKGEEDTVLPVEDPDAETKGEEEDSDADTKGEEEEDPDAESVSTVADEEAVDESPQISIAHSSEIAKQDEEARPENEGDDDDTESKGGVVQVVAKNVAQRADPETSPRADAAIKEEDGKVPAECGDPDEPTTKAERVSEADAGSPRNEAGGSPATDGEGLHRPDSASEKDSKPRLQPEQPSAEPSDLTLLLADEVLLKVFARLRSADLAVASRVCRRWRRLALDEWLWVKRRVKLVSPSKAPSAAKLAELASVLLVAPCLKALKLNVPRGVKLPPINPFCKIRKLSGLNVHHHYEWAFVALFTLAPHLVKLRLLLPDPPHLKVIETMKKLRSLSLFFSESDLFLAPGLPLNLRQLCILGVQTEQLQSVAQMTRLRRVSLHSAFFDLDGVHFPVCPEPPRVKEGYHGLWSMSIQLPAPTALSLLRAHAATLREVDLYVPSSPESAFYAPNLVSELGKIDFKELHYLTLHRYSANNGMLRHDWDSCKAQVADMKKHLPKKVMVECAEGCGMYKRKPGLDLLMFGENENEDDGDQE